MKLKIDNSGWWAALLGLLYFVGAVIYSLVVPMWEGPDEREHFFYVRYVAAEWRIPDAIEEYDSYAWVPTHGPLYYFVAAPFIAQLDTSDISSLPLSNPQATANDLDGLGNRNGYIHTSAEHWPYADANVRALHIARMVTAAFGALAVVAVTLLGSRISPSVGIIAGLLLASNPEFLFLGGLIQNDAPAAALATVALLFLVRYWEAPGCGRAAQVGAVIGLAVLTKASNLGLLGVAGLTIIARRRRLLPKVLLEGATIGGICLIFSAWWLGLNYVRYGDITGLAGSLTLMPGEQVNYAELPNLLGLARFTASSFWALFGASNVLGPGWIYWLLLALAVITGSGIFMNRLHWPLAPALVVCALWAVVITLAGVSWEVRVRSWHARHFFPAIGAYACLVAVGADYWKRKLRHWAAAGALPAASIILAVSAPALIIAPAYRYPPSVAVLPEEAARLCVMYPEDGLELLGIQADPEVAPGGILKATLYWRAADGLTYDLIQFVRLLDAEFVPITGLNAYHGNGVWPTKLWMPGAIYADTIRLRIPTEVNAPTLARLTLSLDRYGVLVEAMCGDVPLDPVTPLAWVRIAGDSRPVEELRAELGDSVGLVSATWPKSVRPGDTIELNLEWLVRAKPDRPLYRFVHVELDERLVTQSDGVAASFPSAFWEPGDVLSDVVVIQIPSDAPTGAYSMFVGMYDDDGIRVPTSTADDRVWLGELYVER